MLQFRLFFHCIQMVGQLVLSAIQEMEFHILSQFLKGSPLMLVLADPKSQEEASPTIFIDSSNKTILKTEMLLT